MIELNPYTALLLHKSKPKPKSEAERKLLSSIVVALNELYDLRDQLQLIEKRLDKICRNRQ